VWDTHLHLDLLGDGAVAQLEVARDVGVTALVGIGVDPRRPARIAVPAGLTVGYAVGLHPQELPALSDDDVDVAMRALDVRVREPDIVAVGECGLDGRKGIGDDDTALARQRRVFAAHLDVAAREGLPVVLHGVRRDAAMLEVLDAHTAVCGPLVGCVWHGYSGSKDTARAAVARGVIISIGFMALEPRARRLREAIPSLPDDGFVLETDAPPLAPARLAEVAAAVAALRGQSVEHVKDMSSKTAARLFSRHPAAR